ncbi:MAG TPA: STAS domain-containing protein [Anaerolineales bacterium]|nr:STAS domain-containing protein [Anaerolineales bacterium]
MTDGFSINVVPMQKRVPVTVFQIHGDIDSNTYDQLEAQAEGVFQSGARDLLLDLSGVPYISSAGIRALHYIFNLYRSDTEGESDESIRKGLRDGTYKSPHFKLLKPNQGVSKLLGITGYDMFLEIHQDLNAALASF